MNTLGKSTYIPLGIAVASTLFLGGLVWKVASWTTITDQKFIAINQKLVEIDSKLKSIDDKLSLQLADYDAEKLAEAERVPNP